eukprot:TRINITY_DN15944_c0_g1_i1.p1 TRINITY_DN15944_c0_g1~~TRINITY_DN15944_c0_g1_i1.p1  ORF type:complete len:503 (+),score=128.48 TRINITY_DN15944_c0_g1_i1:55-1563(+)
MGVHSRAGDDVDREPLLQQSGPSECIRVVRAGSVAILAGITMGLMIGNMSAILDKNESEGLIAKFGVSDDGIEVQLIGAMAQIGCIVGSAMGFAISDAKGRRPTIAVSALFVVAGAGLAALARDIPLIIVGRFLCGVGQGIGCQCVPMYTSELAESVWRARLDASFQLAINGGILIGYAMNVLFMSVEGGYHYALGMPLPLAVCYLAGILMLPESPRWLAQQPGREEEALKVLRMVRPSDKDARTELAEIQAALEEEASGTGGWSDLLAPGQRRAVVVGMLICMLQVGTGIDILTTYASRTFEQCGWGDKSTLAQLLIGAFLLSFTILPILTVERFGARNLLRFGSAAMAFSWALLSLSISFTTAPGLAPVEGVAVEAPADGDVSWASYVAVGAMLMVTATFSISWGPLAWVIPSEVFSLKVRAKAMSVATCFNWLADWTVVFTFLSLDSAVGLTATYAGYAVINALAAVFVWKCVKDHRGLNLEQVQALYGVRSEAVSDGC